MDDYKGVVVKQEIVEYNKVAGPCEVSESAEDILDRSNLESKLNVILKDELNPCQLCPSQFETPEILNIHSNIHHKDGQFPTSCPVCDHVFAPGHKLTKCKQRTFVRHINVHIRNSLKEYKLKKFTCKICGRPMRKEYELKTHMRVHTNEKPFPCNLCDKTFKQRAGLLTHMNSAHMKITFDCQICSGTFSTKSSIMRHMRRIHAKGLTVSCEYCRKFLKDETTLQQHIQSTHGNRIKLRSCNFCDLEVPIMSMRQHIRSHRANGDIVFKRICLLCKAEFVNRQLYNEHINDHLQFTNSDLKEAMENKSFKCRFCSRIYASRYLLLTHMTRHILLGMTFRHSILEIDEDSHHHKPKRKKRIQPKKCKRCKKTVGQCSNQPPEELCMCQQVNPITVYNCKICSRSFHSRYSLIKHHLAHQCEAREAQPRLSRYSCKICRKSIENFTLFCKHLQRHKVCRKYKCKSCHKHFLSKKFRNIHVRSRKCRKYLESVERPMAHKCLHCSKNFFTKEDLDVHLSYHSIEYMVCRFCGVDFKTFKFIRNHMMTQHPGEKLAYCQYCNFGLDTLKDIKTHMLDADHLRRSDSEIKMMSNFDNLELLEGIVQIREDEGELVY